MRRWTLFTVFALLLGMAFFAGAAPALAQAAGDAPVAAGREGLGRLVAALVVAVVTLVLSLFLAMWAIRVAVGMFGRWTRGLDQHEEIKKGNLAVGILMASVVFAIANVVGAGVGALTEAIKPFDLSITYAVGVTVGVVNLVVSLVVATFAVSMAFKLLDKTTKDLDEIAEVKKGNMAVAVFMAGVMISVSFIVQAGVAGIAKILQAERIVSLWKG